MAILHFLTANFGATENRFDPLPERGSTLFYAKSFAGWTT